MLRTMMRAAAALLLAASLRAQVPLFPIDTTNPLTAPGKDVTVSLLTMGNGAEVWELFGHTAIWIHDNRSGRDTVFNWGVFDRSQPLFIPHFLKGLMLYHMGGERLDQLLYAYRYFNRSVVSQELNLSAPQKDSLLAIIRVNARPENVQYRYDYFVDNCSTRPRDILNRVLGGQLRVGADSITPRSYRWHALRLMQGDKPLALGVDIGLGEPSDKPVTRWQEMFLPRELHDWVATRSVRDSAGGTEKLVASERVLFQASREPEPAAPPSFWWLWPTGLVTAALFAVVGLRAGHGHPAARRLTATLFTIWAAAAGILGVILTILWTATDHRFAHANENLLLFNPLWLLLAVMLPLSLLGRRGGTRTRATRMLTTLVAGLAFLALLAHIVRVSRQDNLTVIGLALPVVLAIWYVVITQREPPAAVTAS